MKQPSKTIPKDPKISIVIPTLNAEGRLAACLEALAAGALEGVVKEAIVADAGSADRTRLIADDAGARIITAPMGRGAQLRAGAQAARGDFLLFLHGDTVLDPTWIDEARQFMGREGIDSEKLGVFKLRFDTDDWRASIVARGAMARTKLFSLPYGDQGMLISRSFYERLGGYALLPLFEDVDFIERAIKEKGRGVLHVFKTCAVTSPERYEKKGYARQVISNLMRLARYKRGASVAKLAREYRR